MKIASTIGTAQSSRAALTDFSVDGMFSTMYPISSNVGRA